MDVGAGGDIDVVLFEPKVPEGMTVFVPVMLVLLNVTVDVCESKPSRGVRVVLLVLFKLGVAICTDVVAFDIKVPEFVLVMMVYLDVTVGVCVIDTLTFESKLLGGVKVMLV